MPLIEFCKRLCQVDGLKIQNYLHKMYFRLNSDSLHDKLKNYKAWILEAILTHEFVLYLLVNGYKESSVLCSPLVAFLVISSSFENGNLEHRGKPKYQVKILKWW